MTPSELRSIIKRHGWTQAELAEELDYQPRMIRYWLAGEFPIRKAVAKCIRTLAAEAGSEEA